MAAGVECYTDQSVDVQQTINSESSHTHTHFAYINSNIQWKFIALCTLVFVYLFFSLCVYIRYRINFISMGVFCFCFYWPTGCVSFHTHKYFLLVFLHIICTLHSPTPTPTPVSISFPVWLFFNLVQFIYGQIHMSFSSSLYHFNVWTILHVAYCLANGFFCSIFRFLIGVYMSYLLCVSFNCTVWFALCMYMFLFVSLTIVSSLVFM